MGWNNPPVSWAQLERALSGTPLPESPRRTRQPMPERPVGPVVPYAELHTHSHYSFLDGASSPEQLVAEATRLGLHGIGLTDHDGLYGIVRVAEAAEASSLKTVFGAELSLGLNAPQNGEPDPEGEHLVVLARGQEGYHRLAGALTTALLNADAEKGRPVYDLDALAAAASGHWLVLTGCRKGAVRRALVERGPDAAARELGSLVERFGRDNVVVELFDHGNPLDSAHNDALSGLAARAGLPFLATNVAHYATPADAPLASALAAVRARRSLDELDGWLPATDGAHLRSGAEMAARFSRYPGAIERTVEVADDLSFQLSAVRPKLPKQEVPAGHTPMSWLRELVRQGVERHYPNADAPVHERIEKELAVIEAKDFPGYFLIVHDIVRFARSRGILCQGRGSAANSAVCYALDITAVDSIFYELPFERFLSSLREEEPDIDVDFDSDRREEVIQYVYTKYGRRNAAQVANVISYRPKNAVRDMAKALGYSPGQQDAWSKQVDSWNHVRAEGTDIPQPVAELASQVVKFPRHLGIHSGGMVLTERPVGEVCPIEHARMDGRTVLQWDKDDCAWMGLVKFDLLGLGMLSAMQYAFDLIDGSLGERWTIDSIPREEQGVYDMLCRADAIGVFQVESRAQLATLPRLKPRRYYDLVVEIALIRPGPIQGGAVHPYIRRRTGAEKVSYPHPLLEPVLKRTLGVPLFQEQLMQMAVAVGGCTAEDADLLRRAMGSKRGVEKIETLKTKLYEGMARNGIIGTEADGIYARIQAFANFGFAESHSLSFAVLVYASSWIKLHYPAAFLAALLRAQPMGFYSPATLVADARRHGVEVRRPDILHSDAEASLESCALELGAKAISRLRRDASADSRLGYRADRRCIETARHCGLSAADRRCIETQAPGLDTFSLRENTRPTVMPTGSPECLDFEQPPIGPFGSDDPRDHRRDGAFAVRLGLASVTSIGTELAERIVAERDQHGPYIDLADLSRRVGLSAEQLEALASAGAFDSLGMSRREALWDAGAAAQEKPDFLAGTRVTVQPPLLPVLTSTEQLAYDLWATGISTDDHPIRHVRELLAERGALSIAQLASAEVGRRVQVGGVVIHRQRPQTAGGITFLNIEDETGMLNVIASRGVWQRYRRVAREAPAMVVRGMLERSPDGVTNLVADRFEALKIVGRTRSRDFR